mmetsp:Transcript_13682/g.28692  ORF Transcript_13682/g.28692 Transcript_13682/m.28692 type:complete len:118 (-) Transcript_13682:461-814(-)
MNTQLTAQKSITLCEHDGSIVPVLTRFSEIEIQRLRDASVEILKCPEGKHIIYIKEYTYAEQIANVGGDTFHPGYSLTSFFTIFPEMVCLLDQQTVTEFAPFMNPDELAILRGRVPK